MPTALLPNGQTRYVEKNLDLSLSFPDRAVAERVEQVLRDGLAGDPRQLFIRVQGGGGYGAWSFWLQWGQGAEARRTQPVSLAGEEQTPEAVLRRIQAELCQWDSGASSASQPA